MRFFKQSTKLAIQSHYASLQHTIISANLQDNGIPYLFMFLSGAISRYPLQMKFTEHQIKYNTVK